MNQSSDSEKWLVTRIHPIQLKKLLKLHRKKCNNWPTVCFISNRSEIANNLDDHWMGHNFRTKKHKIQDQSNIFKITTSFLFLISICKSLDQHKDTGVVRQLTETAVFIATPMKKHIQQFILPKQECLFCQLVDRKVKS